MSVAIRDGVVVEHLLKRSLEYYNDIDDIDVMKDIVKVFRRDGPIFESETLDVIIQKIRDSPAPIDDGHCKSEAMETDVDEYAEFNKRYPDLKMLRPKSPASVGKEFHNYLQILKAKWVAGEIDAGMDLVKFRQSIEWILNCDEWSTTSLGWFF